MSGHPLDDHPIVNGEYGDQRVVELNHRIDAAIAFILDTTYWAGVPLDHQVRLRGRALIKASAAMLAGAIIHPSRMHASASAAIAAIADDVLAIVAKHQDQSLDPSGKEAADGTAP